MNRNVLELFRAGCEILDPIVKPHNFVLENEMFGRSSGGEFASGEYIRGDRRLELHLRFSLGLVAYHVGSLSLLHQAYMRALLGRDGGSKYPGFSDEPLDGFRHLSYDLAHYAQDFLSGSGEEFARCVAKAKEQEKVTGFKAQFST
jgi:hypothetical protein